jgi:succinoglycan biosynthesis transport protein ExoP
MPIDIGVRREGESQSETETVSIAVLLEKFLGFLRRHLVVFLFVMTCSLALGFVYLQTTAPQYAASSKLLIDSSKMRVLQQQQSQNNDTPLDASQVDSQVEVLKSDNIGLRVIKKLQLTEDPEFVGQRQGLLRTMFGMSLPKLSESELTQRALGVFLGNRAVARVGRTYALQIEYTSLSANRAAEIANAIGDAYIDDQLDAKYQATRRGSAWLQDRIAELRSQASNADRAVLEYKEKNNIVDVIGGSGSSSGAGARLLGDQQLSDLNSQLGQARSAAAEAQARLQRIDEVMKHDVSDAVVSDSLHSDVIAKLRGEYYELSSRESIWAARYGKEHIAVVNLRTQMDGVKDSIQDELRRIARSYKSDFEIAKAREQTLEKDLATLVSGAQSTNRDKLGLRELESAAQAYHAIYDNFLQRDMEVIQQQSFPITEARIISPAVPPSQKSAPLGSKVLAIAGILGIFVSVAIGGIRETIDRVFRTTSQVESALHTNCLAILPILQSSSDDNNAGKASVWVEKFSWVKSIILRFSKNGSAPFHDALLKLLGVASESDPLQRSHKSGKASRLAASAIAIRHSFMREVVDKPLSTFAEAFRSVKVAVDLGGSNRINKVIGITSTLPGEGKSTVSSNLAQSIAFAGTNVILIDGDLRNPALTRSIAPSANKGLLEVLAGKTDLESAICVDQATQLAFLPAVLISQVVYTAEILASDAFKQLIDSLRKKYDYIIIDLPPIAPVIDARAAAHVVDSFLYVVEWGQTKISFVQRQLAAVPEVGNRMLGVLLNKTNVRLFERYEGNFGKYQYRNYYGPPTTQD